MKCTLELGKENTKVNPIDNMLYKETYRIGIFLKANTGYETS